MKILKDAFDDIGDDEIRIVGSINYNSLQKATPDDASQKLTGMTSKEKRVVKWNKGRTIAAFLFIGAIMVLLLIFVGSKVDKDDDGRLQIKETSLENIRQPDVQYIVQPSSSVVTEEAEIAQKGFVEINDTIINKVPLTIFKPKNLVPRLYVGGEALQNQNASFVVQAADVRRDNGQILGAYVSNGELLSRGQSKAGFCAIINGKLIIGVADSTPYLEQAIETDGYFFRQYPLVVGGQIVENKLKPSSLRKALAELNGEIVVIMNDRKQTLNEFAQTLVDLGVTNAIYLIGSNAAGFAVDDDGNRLEFGIPSSNPAPNINYLVWE